MSKRNAKAGPSACEAVSPIGVTDTDPDSQGTDATDDAIADEGSHGEEWPVRADELEDALLDRLRSAFAAIDADALYALLRNMPRGPLQYVMRSLGLTKTAKLNRGMASALLSRLRTRPSIDVARALFAPFVYVFDHAHLTVDQWHSFLGEDWDDVVTVLEDTPTFAANFNGLIRFPDHMYRPSLMVAALTSANWVPALALLALDDQEAADLFADLRAEHPDLPVSTRRFEDLLPPALAEAAPEGADPDRVARAVAGELFDEYTDLSAQPAAAQGDHSEPSEERDAAQLLEQAFGVGSTRQEISDTANADGRARQLPSLEKRTFDFGSLAEQSLRALGSRTLVTSETGGDWDPKAWAVSGWGSVADELHGADAAALMENVSALDWEAVADVATRVRDDLNDGTAPDPANVAELSRFTSRVHAIADRLTAHVRYPVDPSVESLERAVSEMRENDEQTQLLRSLSAASGPPGLEGPTAELRALAESSLSGDVQDAVVTSLAALARLARLGVEQRGSQARAYAQISSLEQSARHGLPPSVLPIVTVATLGDLRLGTASDVATPADSPDDVTVRGADAIRPDPAAGEAAVPEPDAEESLPPDDELPADLVPETSTEPEADTPSPISDDADDPDVDPTDNADVDFDLSELEAFLTTPAAKSARTRKELTAPLQAADTGSGSPVVTTPNDATDTTDDETDNLAEDPDGHAALHQLEADLLGAGRFGLASMLHRDPAHAAARRIASYQSHLTSATGDLATAFADDQPLITRDALSGDQPGQLIAWAAAARVSVLAPASAAHQVLLELAPRVADYQALTQLGSALATASLNGAIAVPERGEDVTTHQDAARAVQEAVTAARNLLSVAGQRNIKYLPANHVYQDWMAPEGTVGSLLSTVIENDPSRAAETQQRIVDLRRNLDRMLDDTVTKILRKSSKGRRIEAGARQTLMKRLDEALEIVSDWANASIAEAEISDRAKGSARAQRPLENLRRSIAEIREAVLDEIGRLREDCDPATDIGRLEAAAAAAASHMVIATFAAIDGSPPRGAELSPAWVVRSELLAADEPLDPRTLHVRSQPGSAMGGGSDNAPDLNIELREQELAIKLADQPASSIEALYRHRADRNEHDLTEVIVSAATRTDEQAAVQLRVEREEAVAAAQIEMNDAVESTISTVNVLRREETLPESVWSALLADLEGLKAPLRRDFAAIEAQLAHVRSVVETHKTSLMTQARARIESKAADNPIVAQHRQTLLDIVDRGDVAGADEYLEQLTSGEALPDSRDDDRDLRRFFPAVPDLLNANPGLLSELHAALAGKPATDAVRQLFQIAGTDPTTSPTAGRSTARAALGAWAPLASLANGKPVEVTSVVKPILAALGLEFTHSVELDTDRPVGRRFGTIKEILPTGGKAMVPALGSHMGGPGGRSLRLLLVWRAVTPATILEWLSHQREDQTVLVLYMGGTLTAEQRRALATGSRGRPRPVALVIDPAVLAYLSCQPEPSRTALAFTTLPFTAASPYRDTPGDTPPEMFYGRFDEQRAVLDGVSSFVSGGRQLGKSALLRSAQRSFDNGTTRRALFIEIRQTGADGHPEAIWPRLAAELRNEQIAPLSMEAGTATAESVTELISTWLRENPERALLVLIDEADNFLHADADDNFTHVGAFKELMTQQNRRVKFVFAGLHRTARFESLSNQPLAHMGKPIVVGPLRPQAAQDLITRPMAAMGFTFENPRTQTARILAATNSVPSLLQLFGEALIGHMTKKDVDDGPPQRVTDADIATVLDNKELVEAFREKYILTLNLDHRYQVIVHVVALAAHDNGVDSGLRLSEISDDSRQWWPAGFADLPVDYLRGLVTECCDLGLLTHDDGRYRMRTPYVLRLLGTPDEVADVLAGAETNLELRSSLDVGSYRDLIPGTTHRSPLTARQLGEVFSEAGRTHIVVGTEALGVNWAAPHLSGYSERGRSGEFTVQPVKHWTPEGLRAQARMLTKPTMLVVDMRMASTSAVAAVVASEADAHAATTVPLIVLILVTPATLGAWSTQDGQLVELTRVDEAGLRLWCEERDATFDTPEEWEDLATTTGGWPLLVEKALNTDSSSASTPAKRLADLRARLGDPAGATEFVEACGLGVDDPVSAALTATFSSAAYWTDDDPAALDDLIDFLADDEQVVELVRAAGIRDVGTALRALQSVGALVTITTGGAATSLVTTEPVLTAAMRRVFPDAGPAGAHHASPDSGESQ